MSRGFCKYSISDILWMNLFSRPSCLQIVPAASIHVARLRMSFTTIRLKSNRTTFIMPNVPLIRYSIISVHRQNCRSRHPSPPTTIMPSSIGIGNHRGPHQQRAPLLKPDVASFYKISISFQDRPEKRSARDWDLVCRCVIRWPVFHQLWSQIRRCCAPVAIERITRWCDVVRVSPR